MLTRWRIGAGEPYSVADLKELYENKDKKFCPVPGEHYEVDEDFIRNRWDVPDRDRYEVFPLDDSVKGLRRVRSQCILRRRLREVVPQLHGPHPTRGVKDRERRGLLCSVYFRPWVLNRKFATARVPHLDKLDLVILPRWDSGETIGKGPVVRRRYRRKDNVSNVLNGW